MYEPTIITWILIVFGVVTCLPLLIAQIIILIDPRGEKAKDILIGKGEDWRDQTHFKSAYALAVTDWVIYFPLFVLGIGGMFLAYDWGYLLFAVSGSVQLYINTFLWFFEKEYVYPTIGPLKYYTYYWGNFMYWGFAATLYGLLRISGSLF